MSTDLRQEINTTFDELIRVFGSFDEHNINIVPFEGSWTAGQVADHIRTFLSNLPEFLRLHVEPVNRPYDAHAAELRELFLNFNIKMHAPDFTLPSDPPHDQKALLNNFHIVKQQMLDAVNTLDLTMLVKSFELPHTGYLTRYEWIAFFVVHVQRHINQMKNIQKTLLRPA